MDKILFTLGFIAAMIVIGQLNEAEYEAEKKFKRNLQENLLKNLQSR